MTQGRFIVGSQVQVETHERLDQKYLVPSVFSNQGASGTEQWTQPSKEYIAWGKSPWDQGINLKLHPPSTNDWWVCLEENGSYEREIYVVVGGIQDIEI